MTATLTIETQDGQGTEMQFDTWDALGAYWIDLEIEGVYGAWAEDHETGHIADWSHDEYEMED